MKTILAATLMLVATAATADWEVIHGQLLNQEIHASNVTGVTKPDGLIASTEQSI